MGSDEEVEAFEVTDFDLQSAFFPGRRHRLSKNQQIYGIWAEKEDGDSDSERPAFGGRRGKTAKGPVNFVSGGVKHGDNIHKDEEQQEELPRQPQARKDEPIELNFPRTKKTTRRRVEGEREFAGFRGPAGAAAGVAEWERHTRGIGSKIMEKMGFQPGKGLGRAGQGIAKPIQAVQRPGRAALGAYGPEGTRQQHKQDKFAPSDEEEEEEEVSRRAAKQWKKEPGREAPQYRFRTLEQVLASSAATKPHPLIDSNKSNIKVIDMTGREQKVYSGYEALGQRAARAPGEKVIDSRRVFDCPELTHNLDLLVDMTEQELVKNSRQTHFLKDQNVNIKRDLEELTQTMEKERELMDRSREVLALLEEFREKEKSCELTLDDCGELLSKLQEEYPQEYILYGLSAIAIANVLPLLRNALDGWEPLKDVEHGVSLFREWRAIVENPDTRGGVATPVADMDPYHRLVWDAWMPVVRRAALDWSGKDCEPMLRLVETWAPYLPAWILENLLEQIILPRIQTEVDNWNPMTDTVPVHSWLHPWLPLMGDRLQPVYGPIRHKLARALTQWHPSDPSAKMILTPWKEVFSQGSIESFLSQHIVPKLEVCLSNFAVNPANQDVAPWNWVLAWLPLLSPQLLAQLLLRHFFPKWQDALFSWLSCVAPNFQEISDWYSGWKSLVPQQLMQIPLIKEQFNQALEMMNRVVSGGGLSRPLPAPGRPVPLASLAPSMVASFKDLLERRALERGLTFLPVPNKTREGHSVYRVGGLQIYVDRHVVFLQREPSVWTPVSVEQLLALAQDS